MNHSERAKAGNGAATERLKISLTQEQKTRLDRIADEHGLSVAEVVRQVMTAWLEKRGAA